MKFITVMGTRNKHIKSRFAGLELSEYHINIAQIVYLNYIGSLDFYILNNNKPQTGPFVQICFSNDLELYVNGMPSEIIAKGRT